MPNMHVSVFIGPKETIGASSLAIEETKSFSVTVRMYDDKGASEVALYADSLGQLLDFGRAIVAECEKLAPSNKPGDPVACSVAHDPATYAINDAVQHEAAADLATAMVETLRPEDDHPF